MNKDELEKLDFRDWPIPDEYLVEVGRIAALWASLEAFINFCIGKLAGFDDILDPKPFILITHSSFPQKIDMLSTLCEQLVHDYPNLKKYEQTISKLRTAQKHRNRYMHNGMVFNPETGRIEMIQGSARGKLKTIIEPIDVGDIRRALIEIDEAQVSLYKLILGKDIAPVWKRKTPR